MCVCVCESKIGLRRRGHDLLDIENDMIPNVSGAGCHSSMQCFLLGVKAGVNECFAGVKAGVNENLKV